MVSSAQASHVGITRLDLSQLAEAGRLKRLAHGVYMDAGAPRDQVDDLRAVWLSTEPKTLGEERIKDGGLRRGRAGRVGGHRRALMVYGRAIR